MRSQYFDNDKIERANLEASLLRESNNPVMTINKLFTLLKANSTISHFKDIWFVYQKTIRIVLNDHLVKGQYEFRPTTNLIANEAGINPNANFEQITVDYPLEKIMRILYTSIRNMRKPPPQFDVTNKREALAMQAIKRTSYLSELEFNYVFALRCNGYPCGVGSNFFTILLDYIDMFFDKEDVVDDVKPYLKLLNSTDDLTFIRERLQERVSQTASDEGEPEPELREDGIPATGSHLYHSEHDRSSQTVASLKVLRWKFV